MLRVASVPGDIFVFLPDPLPNFFKALNKQGSFLLIRTFVYKNKDASTCT
jgi:hypothetical protein